MSSGPLKCSPAPADFKAEVRRILLSSGAEAVGFAVAEPVDACAADIYNRFIALGRHGSMAWMERYCGLRDDPRKLLEGARTVISCAFAMPCITERSPFASYALPERDYHDVLRERLNDATAQITALFGGATRVCVDSAPIRERFWAQKAGIGFVADNNSLYIPGKGSFLFLAEILWTRPVEPDTPSADECLHCGACKMACPTKALQHDGSCDASECLGFITVEYRGEHIDLPAGAKTAVGCDICQHVCPLNRGIQRQRAKSTVNLLPLNELAEISDDDFRRFYKKSSIGRLKPAMLRRNARALLKIWPVIPET